MLEHALLGGFAADGDESPRIGRSWVLRVALALATGLPALALGWLGMASLRIPPAKEVSLVAPLSRYAYFTFHGDGARHHPAPEYGINTVLRFDLEDPAAAPVAVLGPSLVSPSRMLRDIKVLSDGRMLVVQGYKFDSAILEYGSCTPSEPFRHFLREYRSPQLVHPYAVALMGDEMFASTQDSNMIVGFNLTKVRMKIEQGYSPLVDFNVYGNFRYRGKESYRGIAYHEDCLYVSVVNKDRISVMCRDSQGNLGRPTRKIKIKHPIGLLVDDAKGFLYIASVGKRHGHVAVWDVRSKRFLRKLVHKGMTHPTNMAFRGDTVLVASMTQRALLEFNRTTGAFLRVALSDLPPTPEGLALGDLC